MQFVPLTFKPDNDEYLQEVENVNGIPNSSLVKARWIKPAARRTPTDLQECYLLILIPSICKRSADWRTVYMSEKSLC